MDLEAMLANIRADAGERLAKAHAALATDRDTRAIQAPAVEAPPRKDAEPVILAP